jgi:hypothetical protein
MAEFSKMSEAYGAIKAFSASAWGRAQRAGYVGADILDRGGLFPFRMGTAAHMGIGAAAGAGIGWMNGQQDPRGIAKSAAYGAAGGAGYSLARGVFKSGASGDLGRMGRGLREDWAAARTMGATRRAGAASEARGMGIRNAAATMQRPMPLGLPAMGKSSAMRGMAMGPSGI